MISRFENEYFFLSNFYPAPVEWDGKIYPSSEHAYQAAKTIDDYSREIIRLAPTPGMAKKYGRHVLLRPEWEQAKLSVMEDLLHQKFTPGSVLASKLLATGDEELIEGNWWNDTWWGVCNGVGQNNLGKLLMKIRAELRNT